MPNGPPPKTAPRTVPFHEQVRDLVEEIFRRHPRKVFLLVVLLALIVPAVNLWSFLVLRGRLAEAWKVADRTFQQGNFSAARDDYVHVLGIAAESAKLPLEHTRLAEFMRDLAERCRLLSESLKGTQDSWQPALEEWTAFRRETADIDNLAAADFVLEELLEFPIDDRRAAGDRLILQAARKLVPRVHHVQFPEAEALARLNEAAVILGSSGALSAELNDAITWAEHRLRLVEGLRQFQESADRSIASLAPIDLNRTKGVWQSLKGAFPNSPRNANDNLLTLPRELWEAYVERLEQELRQRIRLLSGTDERPADALKFGHVGTLELPRLPTRDYTALAVLSHRGQPPTLERLIFTRVEDRCYALNAKSGHPVWVLRTGYDAAALPIETTSAGERLLIIPWECETGHAITVATPDPEVRWTWQLPPDAVPTGPPVVVGESLFVSLSTGQIVQLALADGRFLGLAVLPSLLVGPLQATEDGQDAAAVGDNLAIYFFKLRPALELTDILLPDNSDSTVSACAAWIPPFALVFQNDLAGNCEMTVHFRDRERGFRQVAARNLPGRVWQAPVINGTRFLAITDLGTEVVYGLRIDDLSDPLFETFRTDPPMRGAPRQPFSARHRHAPFLAAVGPEVTAFGLDLLEQQAELRRKKRWSRVAPDGTTLPSLPLQTTDEGVVAVTRNDHDNQVRTECFDLRSGESLWRTDLGAPLTEWSVHRQREGGRATVLARGETYEGYRLTIDDAGWSANRLAEVRANASIGYTFETFSAVWTEIEPPELRHSTLEGVTLQRIPLRAPAACPVHVIEGRLQAGVVGENRSESQSGNWAMFTDVAGQFQCVGLNPAQPRIQAAPLPRNAPRAGWYRPLELDGKRFLAAHPEGHLAAFELAQEQRILFLKGQADRLIPGGPIEVPLADGDRLWVCGRDGFCRELSADTLMVLRRVQLTAGPRMARVCGRTLAVALDDGSVAAIDMDADPAVEHPRKVFPLGLGSVEHLVPVPDNLSVVAMDSRGQLFAIDLEQDTVVAGPELVPASLPPLVVGNSLLLGNREGGVSRLSLDILLGNRGQ